MTTLEKFLLNGGLTLLTYLQYTDAADGTFAADSVAATLCAMLSQLEEKFPDVTNGYGWTKADSSPVKFYYGLSGDPLKTLSHDCL